MQGPRVDKTKNAQPLISTLSQMQPRKNSKKVDMSCSPCSKATRSRHCMCEENQSRMHGIHRNPRICLVNFVMSLVTEQVTDFFYFQIFCWGWCFPLMYFLQFHRDSITPNPNLSLLLESPDVFCLCKKYGSGFQKKLPLKSSKKN